MSSSYTSFNNNLMNRSTNPPILRHSGKLMGDLSTLLSIAGRFSNDIISNPWVNQNKYAQVTNLIICEG